MSWVGTYKSIWPHVTSTYAHEVVQAAFDILPDTDPAGDMLESHIAYRRWLVARLQSSQLSQLLPGGADLLPDFYAAIPAWQRPLANFSKPRSYGDLVRHVVNHLDWYLDPTRKARAYAISLTPLILLIGFASAGGLAALLTGQFAVLFPLAFMLVGLAFSLKPYKSMYRDINAKEFYAYIKAAYSDPVDFVDDGFVAELTDSHQSARAAHLLQ